MSKAVWSSGCGIGAGNSVIVLVAIDDTILNRVDVLSLIVLYEDSFGALHAVAKGVMVVYAAGNSVPMPQTVANTTPWVITVTASMINQAFPTLIRLGNSQAFVISTRSLLFPCIVMNPESLNALFI
ncbi:hypothetical protein ZIOFF_020473 [Zingiber officinale]|uniref:Uncharacterized protein n=1 Tax=Zingiber officinale TaxID=94328 RepID=A0A8J5H0A4_ZINOF|nr:hypothetical protein ZIOFF_020473 [Zingiber officinale]